jgi:hypothetical protein
MSFSQCYLKGKYNFSSNMCVCVSENKPLKCVSIVMSCHGRKPSTLWYSSLFFLIGRREGLQFCLFIVLQKPHMK